MPTSTSNSSQAQIADDFHALHRVDIVVHVPHLMPYPSKKEVRSSAIFLVSVVTRTRSFFLPAG